MVWYAGSLNRQGSNSELQLVDERIVGHKPKTLEATEAASSFNSNHSLGNVI